MVVAFVLQDCRTALRPEQATTVRRFSTPRAEPGREQFDVLPLEGRALRGWGERFATPRLERGGVDARDFGASLAPDSAPSSTD
jgi:hypothetical protein